MFYRFIYMGFDIAMEQHSWSHIGFIFFSIVSFFLSFLFGPENWNVAICISFSSTYHVLMGLFLNSCDNYFRYSLELQGIFTDCYHYKSLIIGAHDNFRLFGYSMLWFHMSLGNLKLDCWVISCRAANVFSCAYLVNLARPAHRKIPVKHQKALWYSGKELTSTYIIDFSVQIWITSVKETNCFKQLVHSSMRCLSFSFCEHEQDFGEPWPLPLLCNQFTIFRKDMDRPSSLQLQQ